MTKHCSTLILLAASACNGLYAASTSIGIAIANGAFQVDHAKVSGNSSLFDGSVIETARAASQIQLSTGVQVRLAPETRATVYQRRMVLESGQGELFGTRNFEVEARAMHISGESPDAQARVKMEGGRGVLVASMRGTVRVTNAAGLLVARIEAGNALNLEPQSAGAAAPTRASGCLLAKGGGFVLVERTTNVILALAGSGLDAQVGNRVEVVGRADASQVVSVTELKLIGKGGCTAVAKKIGAASAAAGAATAAATAAGASAGAATAAGIGAGTVAVIGGVAAAATAGGLAIAGDMPGQGAASAPPASR